MAAGGSMHPHRRDRFWIVLAALLTLLWLPTLPGGAAVPTLMLLAVWGLTLLAGRAAAARQRVTAVLRACRGDITRWWLLLIFGWLAALVTWQTLPASAEERTFYLASAVWALLFATGFGLDAAEGRVYRAQLQQRSRYTGFLISLTTFALLFSAAEISMRLWLIQSNGIALTRMAQRWMATYWQPLNELGYRDYPTDFTLDDYVQRVLVVGDSFAAGQGVNSTEDTFAHQLGARLGPGYAVNIVALPGWNTVEELQALRAYPIKPDILIASHYLNDILWVDNVAFKGRTPPPLPEPAQWIITHLELPNFLYWQVVYGAGGDGVLYAATYAAGYEDPQALAEHTALLGQFVDYAGQNNARLVVIAWPMLKDIPESQPYNQSILDYFRQQGIATVDMGAALMNEPTYRIVANPFDAHPSEFAHRRAAELLYDVLTSNP